MQFIDHCSVALRASMSKVTIADDMERMYTSTKKKIISDSAQRGLRVARVRAPTRLMHSLAHVTTRPYGVFSVGRLIAASNHVDVEQMPICWLTDHLNIPVWDSDVAESVSPAARFAVVDTTPMQVIRAPHNYPHHWRRILEADTSYPILVFENGEPPRYDILDGVHRLAKLYTLIGADKLIRVRKLTREQLDKARLTMEEELFLFG
jgi:hypothetical protein